MDVDDFRGGFGFCNPAYADSRQLTNDEYLSTIPDDDPWKDTLTSGAAVLDVVVPGWSIVQIKEKFNECRFYINIPGDIDDDLQDAGSRIAWLIEQACDYETFVKGRR